MSAVRDALDNLITTIEAGTADTEYGNTTGWRYVNIPTAEQLSSIANCNRAFYVSYPDNEDDGRMSQPTNPQGIDETRTVTIAYRLGDNPRETMTVIDEDQVYLKHRLQHPTTYGSAVSFRTVFTEGRDIEETADSGAVLLLSLSVTQRYRPTFSL